jgi:AraC-like DNA-binding protein
VVARIDANYQRRLSLQEVAAAEFVSEAWLSRLFRKEVGSALCSTSPRCACATPPTS